MRWKQVAAFDGNSVQDAKRFAGFTIVEKEGDMLGGVVRENGPETDTGR